MLFFISFIISIYVIFLQAGNELLCGKCLVPARGNGRVPTRGPSSFFPYSCAMSIIPYFHILIWVEILSPFLCIGPLKCLISILTYEAGVLCNVSLARTFYLFHPSHLRACHVMVPIFLMPSIPHAHVLCRPFPLTHPQVPMSKLPKPVSP